MWIATDDGQVVEIAEGVTRIGRSLTAAVRLDDPTVSRRHALIVRTADDVRVLDDRSLGGVIVNGVTVHEQSLASGDVITIGRHTLTIVEGVPASEMDRGIAAA
jgi:pSer/pThr/pTyr-binding forkhead associated (FHA) protein